ncbi:MAG: hypothetical protein IPG80_18470, partial [Anaerolineales bacterium]|nr:hypothetical protein [Anaerolineales bacterium]
MPREVIGEGGALGTISFDKSQKQVAYFYGSMHDTPQVHVRELGGSTVRYLTHICRDYFVVAGEGSRWKRFGTAARTAPTCKAGSCVPPNFDPNKTQYPSILQIHGGPWTQYGKSSSRRSFNYFASNGYVVYFT